MHRCGLDVPLRRDDEGDGADHDIGHGVSAPDVLPQPPRRPLERLDDPTVVHGSGNGRTDGRRPPSASSTSSHPPTTTADAHRSSSFRLS